VRVRLLLDTDLDQEQIERLQQIIDKQPTAEVQMREFPLLGARLIGATPVPEAT
jgi:hypothetical protein